jgi:tartrate dehydratase beta subunit/fumarate hydratase class I family protein
MNPETRTFEPETVETPEAWNRFSVGDKFTLNGVIMVIRKITKKDIVLRPKK